MPEFVVGLDDRSLVTNAHYDRSLEFQINTNPQDCKGVRLAQKLTSRKSQGVRVPAKEASRGDQKRIEYIL